MISQGLLGGGVLQGGLANLPDGGVPLIYNGVFNPRVTRTRASDMTYLDADGLLKVASTDEFPTDYTQFPAQSLWEGSTNLLPYSEDFTNGAWTKFGTTIETDAVTDIFGNANSTRLQEDTSNGNHFVWDVLTVTANTVITGYFIVKYDGTIPNVDVRLQTSAGAIAASFNIQTGVKGGNRTVFGSDWTYVGHEMVSLGFDGWYIVSLSGQTTQTNPRAGLFLVRSTDSYLGDGSSGVYLAAAQTEAKPYPTPYIPTSGTTASRAAPSVSITGNSFASFYNQAEGTFVVDYLQPYQANFRRIFEVTNNTDSERINIESQSGIAVGVIDAGGTRQATLTTNKNQHGARNIIALAYKADNFAIIAQGENLVTDNSGVTPDVNKINIGQRRTGGDLLNGYINNLIYYPRRLSNTELEAITNA